MNKTEILVKVLKTLTFGLSREDEACKNAEILYSTSVVNKGFTISNSTIIRLHNEYKVPNFTPYYNFIGKLTFCSLIADAAFDPEASEDTNELLLRFPGKLKSCIIEHFNNVFKNNNADIMGEVNSLAD